MRILIPAAVSWQVESGRRALSLHKKGNFYFVLLKANWSRILVFIGSSYIVAVAISASVLRAAMGDGAPDDHEQWSGLGAWEASFWMGASNILSLGPGRFTPNSTALSAWCSVQQFGGLILNVFLFSIVVTKFQQPQADVIFSEKAVLTTRDAVPVLMFRIGNKRCNRVYLPTLVVSLMHRRKTVEGESFVEMLRLKVRQPASMAGALTVCHVIDQDSPLRAVLLGGDPLSDDDTAGGTTDGTTINIKDIVQAATERSFAVSVVFSGHDNIYGSDLTAHHLYYHQGGLGGDIAFGGWLLDDVFVRDPRTGKMKVDFNRFSRLRQVAPPPTAVQDPQGHGYVCFKPGGGIDGYTALEAPDLKLGRIYMCSGGFFFADQFRKTCGFTVICELLLLVVGVDYEVIQIDLGKKPTWFTEQTKGTTPAMYLDGTWLCDSSDIIKRIAELYPARAQELQAPDTGAVDEAFLGSFVQPLVKYLLYKKPETPAEPKRGGGGGAKVAVGEIPADELLRGAVEEQIAVVADQIAASGGPFLSGTKFVWADCRLLPMLLMPYSIEPFLGAMGKDFSFLKKYPRVAYYVEAGFFTLERDPDAGGRAFRTSDDAAGLALRKRSTWAPSNKAGRRARDLWLARVFATKLKVPAMFNLMHAAEYAELEKAERAAAAAGAGGGEGGGQGGSTTVPPAAAAPYRRRQRLGSRRASFATLAVQSPTKAGGERPNLCI